MRILIILISIVTANVLLCQERDIEREWNSKKEMVIEFRIKSITEFTGRVESCSDNRKPKFKYDYNLNGDLIQISKYFNYSYPTHLIKYERNNLGKYTAKKKSEIDSSGTEISSAEWKLEFNLNGDINREVLIKDVLDTVRINEMKLNEIGQITEQKSGPLYPSKWTFSYTEKGLLKRRKDLANYTGEYATIKDLAYEYKDGRIISEKKLNPTDSTDVIDLTEYHYENGRIESSNTMSATWSSTGKEHFTRHEFFSHSEYSYLDNGLLKSITRYADDGYLINCKLYEYEYY